MIELISNIQISINQRLDDLAMLVIDSDQFSSLIKDDQKKRAIVKSFRTIKSSEKNRIFEEVKYLTLLSKLTRKMSKTQIITIESMIVNCVNQYLNTQYISNKSGDHNDIIEVFIFYYEKIKAFNKVKQLTAIKNCNLFQQLNFISQNLGFLIANVQSSINYVYEKEKSKFFALLKTENRVLSPQKRQEQDQEEKFDQTGNIAHKTKRQLQIYCFQLSKILNLEHIYIDYFYFSSLDIDKRKKMLQSNFTKRNVYIRKIIQNYEKGYQIHKQKESNKNKS